MNPKAKCKEAGVKGGYCKVRLRVEVSFDVKDSMKPELGDKTPAK